MEARPSIYENIVCHIKGGKVVKVNETVPAVSGRIAYPKEWFDAHKDEKPPIVLPKGQGRLNDLYVTTKKAFNDTTLTGALAVGFIWTAFEERGATLDEDWSSFGVIIGRKNNDVHLQDLANVKRDGPDLVINQSNDGDPTVDQVANLILAICTIYRCANSPETNDYRNGIRDGSVKLMGGEKFESYAASINRLSHLVSYRPYVATMAFVDMYLTRFPNHVFAKARFGTVISRFKDSSVLTAIYQMTGLLSLSVGQLSVWIWTADARDDFLRVNKGGQEVDQRYSYSMYFMELGLSEKSPYSASVNPNLHFLFHAIGSGMGKTRSINAKDIGNTPVSQLMLNAAVVVYANSEGTNFLYPFRPANMPGDPKPGSGESQGGQMKLADMPTKPDPLLWLHYIRGRKSIIPDRIRKLAARRWSMIKDPRDGSVGITVKNMSQVYLEGLKEGDAD